MKEAEGRGGEGMKRWVKGEERRGKCEKGRGRERRKRRGRTHLKVRKGKGGKGKKTKEEENCLVKDWDG